MTRTGWTAAIGAALFAAGCASHLPPRQPSIENPSERTLRNAPSAQSFAVTAYCTGDKTATGVKVSRGMVAADPGLLPMGTVIGIAGLARYDGVYTVMDTGPKIQGHRLDLFITDCREAVRFGRRAATVSIVRVAADPSAKTRALR